MHNLLEIYNVPCTLAIHSIANFNLQPFNIQTLSMTYKCIQYFASRMESVACMYERRLNMHHIKLSRWGTQSPKNPNYLQSPARYHDCTGGRQSKTPIPSYLRAAASARGANNNLRLDHCALCASPLLHQPHFLTGRTTASTAFNMPNELATMLAASLLTRFQKNAVIVSTCVTSSAAVSFVHSTSILPFMFGMYLPLESSQ